MHTVEHREDSSGEVLAFKTLAISELGFYWSPGCTLTTPEEMEATLKQAFAKREISPDFILRPSSIVLDLALNKNILNPDMRFPKVRCKLMIEDIVLSISQRQWECLVQLLGRISLYNKAIKYAAFRPSVPIKKNVGAWWRYAVQAVLMNYKERSKCLDPFYIEWRRRMRQSYIEEYKQFLKPGAVKSPELVKLEKELSFADIAFFRSVAELNRSNKVQDDGLLRSAKEADGPHDPEQPSWLTNLSAEERAAMFKALDVKISSANAAPTSPSYVKFEAVVQVNNLAIELLTIDSKPFARFWLTNLTLESLIREKGLRATAFIESLKLVDHYTLGDYRDVIKSGFEGSDALEDRPPFLQFEFDMHPVDFPADYSVRLALQPLVLVFNKEFVKPLLQFFSASEEAAQEISDVAEHSGEQLQRQTQAQIEHMVSNRENVALDILISGLTLLIPQNPKSREAPCVVASLSQISFYTEHKEFAGNHHRTSQFELYQAAFTVSLSLSEANRLHHLISPTTLFLSVQRPRVDQSEALTIHVEALTRMHLTFSSLHFRTFLALVLDAVDSIKSPPKPSEPVQHIRENEVSYEQWSELLTKKKTSPGVRVVVQIPSFQAACLRDNESPFVALRLEDLKVLVLVRDDLLDVAGNFGELVIEDNSRKSDSKEVMCAIRVEKPEHGKRAGDIRLLQPTENRLMEVLLSFDNLFLNIHRTTIVAFIEFILNLAPSRAPAQIAENSQHEKAESENQGSDVRIVICANTFSLGINQDTPLAVLALSNLAFMLDLKKDLLVQLSASELMLRDMRRMRRVINVRSGDEALSFSFAQSGDESVAAQVAVDVRGAIIDYSPSFVVDLNSYIETTMKMIGGIQEMLAARRGPEVVEPPSVSVQRPSVGIHVQAENCEVRLSPLKRSSDLSSVALRISSLFVRSFESKTQSPYALRILVEAQAQLWLTGPPDSASLSRQRASKFNRLEFLEHSLSMPLNARVEYSSFHRGNQFGSAVDIEIGDLSLLLDQIGLCSLMEIVGDQSVSSFRKKHVLISNSNLHQTPAHQRKHRNQKRQSCCQSLFEWRISPSNRMIVSFVARFHRAQSCRKFSPTSWLSVSFLVPNR